MDFKDLIGLTMEGAPQNTREVQSYLNLKLAALGLPAPEGDGQTLIDQISSALLAHYREAQRLLAEYLCPADQRIQDFLDAYLKDLGTEVRVPARTLILDRYGLARVLSSVAQSQE
jgi:phosphoenolpyruvate carboxykinase (diphosphate)